MIKIIINKINIYIELVRIELRIKRFINFLRNLSEKRWINKGKSNIIIILKGLEISFIELFPILNQVIGIKLQESFFLLIKNAFFFM
jgi:hypothetical protein